MYPFYGFFLSLILSFIFFFFLFLFDLIFLFFFSLLPHSPPLYSIHYLYCRIKARSLLLIKSKLLPPIFIDRQIKKLFSYIYMYKYICPVKWFNFVHLCSKTYPFFFHNFATFASTWVLFWSTVSVNDEASKEYECKNYRSPVPATCS